MMRLRALALLSAATLLTGCAQPLAIKGLIYDREHVPDRVLVNQTTFLSVPDAKASNGFKTEFRRLLDACGVPTAFAVNNNTPGKSVFAQDSVEAAADVETELIQRLRPTFVLHVKELRATYQGTVRIVDMEALLHDTASKRVIWRANGSTRKTPLFNQITLEDFARGLVDKMREDNILRSCPATLNTKPKEAGPS